MSFDDQMEEVMPALPGIADNHRPSVQQHPIYAILSRQRVEEEAASLFGSRVLA
jgi:hypothetical protein